MGDAVGSEGMTPRFLPGGSLADISPPEPLNEWDAKK